MALRDRDFRLYLVGASLVVLAWNPLDSFLPLFMREHAGLAAGQVIWLELGGLLGGLVAGYAWGWAADRYGSKPVMLTGLFLLSLTPILWLVMPRFSAMSVYAALGIAFLRGLLALGWAIGSGRLLFVNLVPPEKKAAYMAVYYAWMGAVGGLSQLLGGRVLDLTGGISGRFLFLSLDPYTVLFVAGIALPLVAGALLRRIRTDSGFSATEFAGMFLQGNPLLAAESLIRYGRARDEQATVSVTERLGSAKSRLTVEELLEALADPRFNVRFEAVLALARMPADARVVDALGTIVASEEPALAVVAAWALGRMGDERGVPALREGLASPYRSVQAHSARALGTLEDAESAARLRERFERETDHGLRLAYASALGKLGQTQAAQPLLEFLRTRRDPGARMELALTLARLLGGEHHFIQLWRRTQGEAGTGLAQALQSLRRRLEKTLGHNRAATGAADAPEPLAVLAGATEAFAHSDLAAGAAGLGAFIRALPPVEFDPLARAVLGECAARLEEFGAERREYILLAVHALHEGALSAAPHPSPADAEEMSEPGAAGPAAMDR
jgi:MFS family permease